MGVTTLSTVAIFLLAPCIGASRYTGVLYWSHWLGTIALISTLLWSIFGLVSIYYGPHHLFDHSQDIGRGMFLWLTLVYVVSLAICIVGVVLIWHDQSHWHLVCILIAEILFLVFDRLLIRKIAKIELQKTGDQTFLDWAAEVRLEISGWMYYVDIPVVFGLIVLNLGSIYLDRMHIFVGKYECELFCTGAVFFALTTANLAFAAANSDIVWTRK
jgi:hypothetical protein